MSEKKIIAVTGATGAQGGGLARAILEDENSEFTVRAITRNTDSDNAKALRDLGAEVVGADLDDIESLKRAFDGAYGAFCLTNFWEHFSPEKEAQQARNMAEAARSTGVEHVIWSSLEDTRELVPLDDDRMPTLMEKYKVPHFDAKGEANEYFEDLPATIFNTSFYWDNLIYFGMGPKPGPDGKLVFALPMADKKLPGIAAADIGKCAYGVFKAGDEYIGETVGVAGEHLTGEEMAETLSDVLDREVVYYAVDYDEYRNFDFPGAEDLGNMFQYKAEFNDEFCGGRDLTESKELNPDLQTFEEWARANKERIPIEEPPAMETSA